MAGAFFLGFIMLPGSIYLGLVVGQSMGAAAEWTTIILFTEIARRSYQQLTKQEIYILYYMAASLMGMMGGVALSGGPFAGLIWNQFLVRSDAARAFGIADKIPSWVVPPPDSPALLDRTFMHKDWIVPIILLVAMNLIGRLTWIGMGYFLFRVTSDYEKLPFPFAPIQAQGAMALAEVSGKKETWRWRMFSIGAMIGIVFGAFYVGIPAVTGTFMSKPVQLIPIPFLDLTQSTETFLPATPTPIATDVGSLLVGFVVPFWAVLGGFCMALTTLWLNPFLFQHQVLKHWRPGMDAIQTSFANSVDFYMSVGIGTAVAIAIIGFYTVIKSWITSSRERRETGTSTLSMAAPAGRGDFPIWLALGMWITATVLMVGITHFLVPDFPVWYLLVFAFVLTPGISYVNARLNGLVGQQVGIPMIREASFIMSGYKGVDIWFAPIPYQDFGGTAQTFRVVELTGTKFTSLYKVEALMFPIILITSFAFWSFMWHMAPIPSVYYPYAQKFWHLQALQQSLWMTATTENKDMFMEAMKPWAMLTGFSIATVSFIVLALFKLPILFIYGFVGGIGQVPSGPAPMLVGALISRYYFERKYGQKQWKQWATVLLAGLACGMGLIGMGAVAVAMISQAVIQLPY